MAVCGAFGEMVPSGCGVDSIRPVVIAPSSCKSEIAGRGTDIGGIKGFEERAGCKTKHNK